VVADLDRPVGRLADLLRPIVRDADEAVSRRGSTRIAAPFDPDDPVAAAVAPHVLAGLREPQVMQSALAVDAPADLRRTLLALRGEVERMSEVSRAMRAVAVDSSPAEPADSEDARLAYLADEVSRAVEVASNEGLPGPLQAERAGVLASFILNAAMIPGWPPPRPLIGGPSAGRRKDERSRNVAPEFLADILRDPTVFAQVIRKIGREPGTKRLLRFLDLLLAELAALADAVLAEIDALLDEEESGRQPVRRRHILPLTPKGTT